MTGHPYTADIKGWSNFNKNIKSKVGWKVFSSEIKLIGGKENYDLASELMDWNDLVDDEEEKMDEDGSESDDLEAMEDFFFTGEDLFETTSFDKRANQQRPGKRNTLWISSGSNVEIGTLINDELQYSVKLEGINSEVTDIQIHEGLGKDFILVFSSSGLMYVFDGHPVSGRSDCIQPIIVYDTHHGGVIKAASLGSYFGKQVDADFVTIGQDRRMKTWKLSETNGSTSIKKVYESSDVFLSKPVGIELVKLREKHFLYVALEDGSLIRQEVKLNSKPNVTSILAFGSKQNIEGNGKKPQSILSANKVTYP